MFFLHGGQWDNLLLKETHSRKAVFSLTRLHCYLFSCRAGGVVCNHVAFLLFSLHKLRFCDFLSTWGGCC